METRQKTIIYYKTIDDKCPYIDWFETLDGKTQAVVKARIDRMKDGLYGDWKRLTNSKLSELRIDFGKGYRVYYRELNNIIIVVVAGSDKSNQNRTIKQADKYLAELLERTKKK